MLTELLGGSASTALRAWVEAPRHVKRLRKKSGDYGERLKRLESVLNGSENFRANSRERDKMLANLAEALLLRIGDTLYSYGPWWWSRISDPPTSFASGYAQLLWEKGVDQIFGGRWYSDQYYEWERTELIRLIRRLASVFTD
jgi:hypothetical protein